MTNPFLKANHNQASTGFAPLPAGKYELFIESGQVKTTSSGSPMINWKLVVRADVQGQTGGGRKIFSNLVFQENTAGMVHGFYKAIGVPDGHEFGSFEDIVAFAKNRPVKATLKVTTYKGEDRNEIGYFMPSEVGGQLAATPAPAANQVPNFSAPQPDPFATNAPSEDPFAVSNGPVTVSEDDLPF